MTKKLVLTLILSLVSCGATNVDEDEQQQDSAGEVTLVGCRNPAAWECSDWSDGNQCHAMCDGQQIVCNQDVDGGTCYASSGGNCDAPQSVSGCSICYEAILGECADEVRP